MSRKLTIIGLSVTAAACCAVTLGLNKADSQTQKDEKPVGKADQLRPKTEETKRLGGAERYLTALSTDKPIYRTGEKVYARGVLLQAATHKPLSSSQSTPYATVEVRGPKGDVVASGQAAVQDSVWGYLWEVPEGQAGGEYTIHASYGYSGHAPAERKFDVRAYRAPRLNSQITFLRDGYGPGENVSATLEVKRAEGDIPVGAKVTVTAQVDGVEVKGAGTTVDANGLCSVSLDLPREIPRGDGTLALVIEDGGTVETASKSIPILLQTVDLQIFPEGGDLVAGYKNRVYIQAKQTNGKPADLVGKLISEDDNSVTEFKTEHEGRGRFEFTPEPDKNYYLTVSQPAGIKKHFKLPAVKPEGAVVSSDKMVFDKADPISVRVGCSERSYRVTLAQREVEIAAFKVNNEDQRKSSLKRIQFDVPSNIDGVLAVTVWNDQNIPLAERLVFKKPAHPLNISIKPDKKNYVPGDKTKLTVKATDESGKPVSAVVGITVTDNSVLEMVEKREQAPRLPVMVFLEPEVEDLKDAHIYLDPKNQKAALATDLLLGTQGWRRYGLMDIPKFIEAHGDKSRRVMAMKLPEMVNFGLPLAGGGIGVRGALLQKNELPGAALAVAPPVPQPEAPMPKAAPKTDLQAKKIMQIVNERPTVHAKPVMVDARQNSLIKMDEIAVADEEIQMAVDKSKRARRDMNFSGAAFGAGERGFLFRQANLVVVREYAHSARANRQPTDRVDFDETLFWNAGVKTDPATGEASISFDLNDNVTTFKVFADAFTGGGAIGSSSIGVESVQPFYTEAKLPLEVTAGDEIRLPITFVNASGNSLTSPDFKVDLNGEFNLATAVSANTELRAGERIRVIQPIVVGTGNGTSDFVLNSKAGLFSDKVTSKLKVKPNGFRIVASFGGMLAPCQPIVHNIVIPDGVIKGSISSNTAVYPTPLANLTEALQRMIQDPYGCFEQTSATSYPLTMAQQYFVSHTGVDPKLVQTSREKLDKGYKQLVGFWCPDRGYEWFGENPGHEALTAFGLLHFSDMAQVREVDQNMIATTRTWLLKQRDGKGGFNRKRRSLHSWIEDKDCSNAYITWSLLESGQSAGDLKTELQNVNEAATRSQNSYVIALAANALSLAGSKGEAIKLMERLAQKQAKDGSVGGITASIVGSGGESLAVEGTALATLAWMREPAYAGNVEKSIKFLADSCKAGRYGSTQATVLALRAIVNYDKQKARPKADGRVCVYVDGKPMGSWQNFSPSTQGAIKLPDIADSLTPGEHKLELRMEGGGAAMPYSLAVNYNAIKPADSAECKLDIAVRLAQNKLVEGTSTEATVTVINKNDEVLPSPVAIVGLPGGLEPRHDQLKELVKKGAIDCYEVLGREVVLYWRALPARSKAEIPISLIAAVPGTYNGPASRTYLYYTDEHKKWAEGVKVEIAAK